MNTKSMVAMVALSLWVGFVLTGCADEIVSVQEEGSARFEVWDAEYVTAEADFPGATAAGRITVMTRNMYVGADVDRIFEAPAPEEIPVLVAEAWAMLQQTNFAERARAMAQEIAHARPHLVGLQEVSRLRTQTPGDAVVGGTTPAEDLVFDFLPTLLGELDALGQSYRAVAQIENIDAELPRVNPDLSFTDVRLTDYDVILARSDVAVSNVVARNYAASFEVFGVEIKRGWLAVDATIQGRTYRFVNTHLEPVETADGLIQHFQAGELIATLAGETRPLILVGDLNADAPDGQTYALLREAGYVDSWPADAGFTCCHAKDLSSPTPLLNRRIDLILVKNVKGPWLPWSPLVTLSAGRVGEAPGDKTPSGLWPSDHAGLVSRLYIP